MEYKLMELAIKRIDGHICVVDAATDKVVKNAFIECIHPGEKGLEASIRVINIPVIVDKEEPVAPLFTLKMS
jgi:hypothetical protein